MVLSEFQAALRARGVSPTDTQLRWAIRTEKIPRPRIDASHRFDFTATDVENAVQFFASRREAAPCR